MRNMILAGALALVFTGSAVAFEPPPEVLALEVEAAATPDSTGVPMDNCCVHEEDEGWFMGYPPNIWYDSSTHYINCQDMRCLEEEVGRVVRELGLQDLLRIKAAKVRLSTALLNQ